MWLRYVAFIYILADHVASIAVLNSQLGHEVFKNYTEVIPICNSSAPLVVTVNLFLYQIVDISLQDGTTTLNIWLDMIWHDCTIIWDRSKYNINVTQFPNSLPFWVPDLAWREKDNNVRYASEYYAAQPKQISSTGNVFMTTQLIPALFCTVDSYYYPFDVQECNVTFFSVGHDLTEINITSLNPNAVLDYYQSDGRWDLDSFNAYWSKETSGNREFATVTYSMVVNRKQLYYIIFVTSPLLIFCSVAVLVFGISVPTEEKISFSTNVLLNVCMYFLVLLANLPKQSNFVPLIGRYLGSVMMLVTACVLATVVTLRCYWNKECRRKALPHYLETIFNRFLAKLLRMPWVLAEHTEARRKLYEMQLRHFHRRVTLPILELRENWTESSLSVGSHSSTPDHQRKLSTITNDGNTAASTTDTDLENRAADAASMFGDNCTELAHVDATETEATDQETREVTQSQAQAATKRGSRFWRNASTNEETQKNTDRMRSCSTITISEASNIFYLIESTDVNENPELKKQLEQRKRKILSHCKSHHNHLGSRRAHWKRTAGNPWSQLSYVCDRMEFVIFVAFTVVINAVMFFIYM